MAFSSRQVEIMKARHLLIAAAFWIVLFVTLGCSSGIESGPTGQTAQPITSVCYTNIGGVSGVYPWNATFPMGGQRVYCEHQPTAFAQANWAPNVSLCTGNPNGGQIPGTYQVDVWLRNNVASPNTLYKCARVTTPVGSHFNLAYEPMMEYGWFTNYPLYPFDGDRRWWITGIFLGPGTGVVTADSSSVSGGGCPVPSTGCFSTTNAVTNPATWYTVDTYMYPASLDLYRF